MIPSSKNRPRRLSLLLAGRITPLFFLSSIGLACLAYWQLADAIHLREEVTVKCSAIVCKEVLDGQIPAEGPTARQLAALKRASRLSEVRLVFSGPQGLLLCEGEDIAGEATSHREQFAGVDGTAYFIESQIAKAPGIEQLRVWRLILSSFCLAATAFGAILAAGFGEVVRRATGEINEVVPLLGKTAPSEKSSRMAEMAGLQEAVRGLHAFLAYRRGAISRLAEVDFSLPRFQETGTVRVASREIMGEGGVAFHGAAGCGGFAGVAPDRRIAAAALARLGRQLCEGDGPDEAVLGQVAAGCPQLEAVVLDGVRSRRWLLSEGRIFEQGWQILGIVSPGSRAVAQKYCEQIAGLASPGEPGAMLETLSGSIVGPAAMVAVCKQEASTR